MEEMIEITYQQAQMDFASDSAGLSLKLGHLNQEAARQLENYASLEKRGGALQQYFDVLCDYFILAAVEDSFYGREKEKDFLRMAELCFDLAQIKD